MNENNHNHSFLTAQEVSLLFRIPISSVYRLVKTGTIRAVVIGRHVRIFRAEIERLCSAQFEKEESCKGGM